MTTAALFTLLFLFIATGMPIAIALGLKLIFIALAMAGVATLWMAIAADMGASLLVIFNGLRLLRG